MTDTDKPAFLEAITGLVIALREQKPDTPQLRVYFEALKVFDIELVTMAAVELAQTAKYFPKTSEWREAILAIEKRQRLELAARIRRIHLTGGQLCAQCDDTGMAPNAAGRYARCACQAIRKLEILGVRPMPALPAHEPVLDLVQETRLMQVVRAAVKAIP